MDALGLRVLPGKHTLLISYSGLHGYTDTVSFTCEVVAGHSYIIEGEEIAWDPGTFWKKAHGLARLTLRDTTTPTK
jgi:hypothetical protein